MDDVRVTRCAGRGSAGRRGAGAWIALLGLGLPGLPGCGVAHFPADLPITLEEYNDIQTDDSLTAQEKRDALAGFGLDEVTINALLRTERTGNQFGGTLTSAWELVNAGRLADLTPDEVQLYGDAAEQAFDDDEAQAIVDLFNEAQLNTADELADFLDNPVNEVDSVIDVDELRAAFIDTDPADLVDQLP